MGHGEGGDPFPRHQIHHRQGVSPCPADALLSCHHPPPVEPHGPPTGGYFLRPESVANSDANQVVIRHAGPAVGAADTELVQQLGDGPGDHGRASVGVDDELVPVHAVASARFSDQAAGVGFGLGVVHGPAGDLAAVDVDDRVQEVLDALGWAAQGGDIPGPHLVRRVGFQAGHAVGPELVGDRHGRVPGPGPWLRGSGTWVRSEHRYVPSSRSVVGPVGDSV